MISASVKLSNTFNNFFASEKSSGILLIFCTLIAILMTNSSIGHAYLNFWQVKFGGLSLELWINDGLMAVFFLLIGLELKRELYIGELSNFKNALLPIVAAIGGMLVPALIYFTFNHGTPTQDGIGIPMATDIAFALGVLAILGKRIPASLKVFVVAFAVIDDLGAIVVIALFYTAQLSAAYLAGAFAVWALLLMLNRALKVMLLLPYIICGLVMWFLMLKSGIHATIAGVMLAFVIPFSAKDNDKQSPSHRLESFLHKPVAFVILPIFALANTGITFDSNWFSGLASLNGLGIVTGLIIGKPLGIVLMCYFAVLIGICQLPSDLKWAHITGAGMLGGIGFTMSIFITNLAFLGSPEVINTSKMAILLTSLTAGILGFLWLRVLGKNRV
ncbi:Na+/H+ antiporter NhaA [Methylotenera oryzisoli]|uniref:Na(+)/H(+) antiporter NhaA n=1 Tax=Methylotenera oryzisoli TaxID=2080758 RepID=A0A4Y9VQ61_9PROT|nr:Na+/H+ antiporter NhaA [Methylotenera oryzisoli]TFW70260.1 Na+/H+ antiporter NhaA [Methylotenera oryzisoli]